MIARAEQDAQAKFLLRNGADGVVYPEKQMAVWTAIRYSSDHILDYIALEDDHAIFEIEVPGNWVGKTIAETVSCKHHGHQAAGKILHDGDHARYGPAGRQQHLGSGDTA